MLSLFVEVMVDMAEALATVAFDIKAVVAAAAGSSMAEDQKKISSSTHRGAPLLFLIGGTASVQRKRGLGRVEAVSYVEQHNVCA